MRGRRRRERRISGAACAHLAVVLVYDGVGDRVREAVRDGVGEVGGDRSRGGERERLRRERHNLVGDRGAGDHRDRLRGAEARRVADARAPEEAEEVIAAPRRHPPVGCFSHDLNRSLLFLECFAC